MSSLNKKKICFITGSRAEYGLIENLIDIFSKDKSFKTYLIVTGSHLSKKFGMTFDRIYKKKITIKKIKLNLDKDTNKSLYENQRKLSHEINNFCSNIKPTCFVVLGDRFEIFSICSFIQFLNIPIIHLHGGEKTTGSLDDQLRHCITKMSHIHFVANKEFKKRVLQLGELKKSVHIVGGLGIDKIKKISLLSKSKINKKIKFDLKNKNILINVHPDTIKRKNTKKITDIICEVINKYKNINFIITYPNFDIGHEYIIKKFKELERKKSNVNLYHSLGDQVFLSVLKNCDVMIGNSSSAFTEAPYFKTPAINIGDRQNGRPVSKNIHNTKISYESINSKLKFFLKTDYRKKIKRIDNKYGNNGASKKIYNIIKKTKFNENLLKKEFNDL